MGLASIDTFKKVGLKSRQLKLLKIASYSKLYVKVSPHTAP